MHIFSCFDSISFVPIPQGALVLAVKLHWFLAVGTFFFYFFFVYSSMRRSRSTAKLPMEFLVNTSLPFIKNFLRIVRSF